MVWCFQFIYTLSHRSNDARLNPMLARNADNHTRKFFMKNLVDLSQANSDISEEEIIQRTVIAGIELYADRLLPISTGAKSTVIFPPELDSKLNAAKDFLGINRQDMVKEAVEFYFRWALYAEHINQSTLDIA